MTEKYVPPKEENQDLPARLTRVVAGAVPLFGPTLMDLIADPIQERRQQWEDEVAYGLNKLEAEHSEFGREQLRTNQEFATALLQATQIAQRTHSPEKREALRNAVLNVACGRAPEDDLQHMFLQWVEALTVGQIRILALFRNPSKVVDMRDTMMGGLTQVIERALPDMRGKQNIYEQMFKDLQTRGLIAGVNLHTTMTGAGLVEKRTTELGEAFLRFIESPVDQASTNAARNSPPATSAARS